MSGPIHLLSATEISSPFGSGEELLTIRIDINPPYLEDLLDSLARLDFPVNPELHHLPGFVSVEFPVYRDQAKTVTNALRKDGLDVRQVKAALNLYCAPQPDQGD